MTDRRVPLVSGIGKAEVRWVGLVGAAGPSKAQARRKVGIWRGRLAGGGEKGLGCPK